VKPDKDKIIPWLGVVFAGLLLGALGRHIALQQSGDTGTANLTFVIVLAGIVFMYLLFLMLWDSIHQIINKKRRTSRILPDDLSDDDIAQPIGLDGDDMYPYNASGIDGCEDVNLMPDDEEVTDDFSEEETPPTIDTTPAPTRPDWVEVREREFQDRFAPFREYVHFAMEPYVSAEELARLDGYVELFAREASLPSDIVTIRPKRLKNPDLCRNVL
jgi:hypothetical protein